MSYRIEPGEAVADAIRRIAREQVDKALDTIDDPNDDPHADPHADPHEKVHEGRKRCKKIRGLVRLTRPAFEDTYDRENGWYRDAARTLSDLRDAAAFLESFDALLDRFDDEIDRRHFTAIRQAFEDRRDRLAEAQDIEGRLGAFAERMRVGRQRIDGWTLDEDGFDAVAPGVKKTYKRTRHAMEDAYDKPADDRFHEWRKRVKYHRYHCRLLRHAWKPVLDERRDEIKRLSDLLGDEHDIAELRAVIRDEQPRFGPLKNLDAFGELLDRRQAELRAWARPLGQRCFDEKGKRLIARLETDWDAWQADQQLADRLPEGSAKVYS